MIDPRVQNSMKGKRITRLSSSFITSPAAWVALVTTLFAPAQASGIYSFPHLADNHSWRPPAQADFGSIADQDDLAVRHLIALVDEVSVADTALEASLHALSALPVDAQLTGFGTLLDSDLFTQSDWQEQVAVLGRISKRLLMLGQSGAAIRSAEQAIEHIHAHRGQQSPQLIPFHLLIAMARQQQQSWADAQYHLAQAMSLMHRRDGTLTAMQLPILQQRAANLLAMDEPWKATQVLKATIRISDHSLGERSVESTQTAMLLIRHLRNLGHYHQALSLFNARRELLRDADGLDSPASIALLNEGSLLHLLTFNPEVDRGLRLQQHIVEIQNRNPAMHTAEQRLEARLRLGDWMLLFDRQRDAAQQYAQAWALIDQTESPQQWRDRLSRPELIHAGPNPSLTELGLNRKYSLQWAEFDCWIDPDGRPTRVRINDTNLHGVMRNRVLSLFRQARFRPALDNGMVMTTPAFAYRRVYDTVPHPSDVTLYQSSPRDQDHQRRIRSRHLMPTRLPRRPSN